MKSTNRMLTVLALALAGSLAVAGPAAAASGFGGGALGLESLLTLLPLG